MNDELNQIESNIFQNPKSNQKEYKDIYIYIYMYVCITYFDA